jgi:uncharacterized membrane protein
MGPTELLVIEFPGNRFKGEIVPALREVADRGVIRIIDLVAVRKEADGSYTALELSDLSEEEAAPLDPLADEVSGLLSPDDIAKVADALANESTAGIMLFEHVWAERLRNAIVNANGRLVLQERISQEAMQAALEAAEAEKQSATDESGEPAAVETAEEPAPAAAGTN